jgi:hypothetical protein
VAKLAGLDHHLVLVHVVTCAGSWVVEGDENEDGRRRTDRGYPSMPHDAEDRIPFGGGVMAEYETRAWSVTSQFTVAPINQPALDLEVTTLDRDLIGTLQVGGLMTSEWETEPLWGSPLGLRPVGFVSFETVSGALQSFFQPYGFAGEQARQALLEDAPIPVFGSSPTNWTTLQELMRHLTPAGSAGVLAVSPIHPSPLALLGFFAGMTVIVRVIDPIFGAVGGELSNAVKDWLRKHL